MTTLKTAKPPTYTWVPIAFVLALPASALLGWWLFLLVGA